MIIYSNGGGPVIPLQPPPQDNGQQQGSQQTLRLTDTQVNQAVDDMLAKKQWEDVALLSMALQKTNEGQWVRLKEQFQQKVSQQFSTQFQADDHGGKGTTLAHMARFDPQLSRTLYERTAADTPKDRQDDLARGFYRGIGSEAMNSLARTSDGRALLEKVKTHLGENSDGVSDQEKRYIEFVDNKLQHVQLGDPEPEPQKVDPNAKPSYTEDQALQDAIKLAQASWRDGDSFLGMKISGSGWGTDEDTIWQTLEPRTTQEVQMIRDAYRKEFDRDLDADMRDEMSDEDLDHVNALLQGGTKADDKSPVRNVASDVVEIHAEVHGIFGDEDEVLQSLEKTPWEYRKTLAEAYAKRYGSTEDQKDATGYILREFEDEGGFNDDEMKRARGLFTAPVAGTEAQPMTTGEAEAAAGRLHTGLYKAGDWLPFRANADGDTVIDVFNKNGDAGKLKMISAAYERLYDEKLEDVVSRRMEGSEKDVALSLLKRPASGESPESKTGTADWQADQDATRLYDAVDGAGTDEGMLRSTLDGKSAEQIDAIALKFYTRYAPSDKRAQWGDTPTVEQARQVLRDRLADDLGGSEKGEILHMLEAPKAADKEGLSQWEIDHDARRLKLAVDGMGTDEDLIREVLAGRTKPEIDAIEASYERQFHHDLRGRLDDEMDGRDELEIVEHDYDLGVVDMSDPEAAAAEVLLRAGQRAEYEKDGWFTNYQKTTHFLFHGDTDYKSDAELTTQRLSQGDQALKLGDYKLATRYGVSAGTHLENWIHNKDATTNLVAEAAVLAVTLPIVFLSGGTFTPVEAVIIGAFAGAATAGATYTVLDPQVGAQEIGRRTLIGAAEGATAGVPLGRAATVTKELTLAARASRQAIKMPVLEGTAGAARTQAVAATGVRLTEARAATAALPTGLKTTLKDGAIWGAAGGGAYGFTDSMTQHETWQGGFGDGVLKVLKTTGSSAVFGVGLSVPMSAGFHAAFTPLRRRAEARNAGAEPEVEPLLRRGDDGPSSTRVRDGGNGPRNPDASGAAVPAAHTSVPIRITTVPARTVTPTDIPAHIASPVRTLPPALAPFRPDPVALHTETMASMFPLVTAQHADINTAFAPRDVRRRNSIRQGDGPQSISIRIPAPARAGASRPGSTPAAAGGRDAAPVTAGAPREGFQTYLGDGPAAGAGAPDAPGTREIFVNPEVINPKTGEATGAVRRATLHDPGSLPRSDLEHMALEVYNANKDLPGSEYVLKKGETVEGKVAEIADVLDGKYVVRVEETMPGAEPQLISGAAVTPNWQGKKGDGKHWLGHDLPTEGYTYLSHVWAVPRKGGGNDVTEAAVLAAQQHLGQTHFGFYTRWQGAQGLYGPSPRGDGLGAHPVVEGPPEGAHIPRMHITEASFMPEAAQRLYELPRTSADPRKASWANLPDEVRQVLERSDSPQAAQAGLAELHNPMQWHGELPPGVLRASYETVLLHEGVRVHPPRATAAEGGTLTIAVNNHETFGPPDPRRHVNWLPNEPRFAKVREAAEYYTPTYDGVQIITHAEGVYVRDPVTGEHYSENWPVGPDGKPMSPYEAARRLQQRDAREGPAFFLSCEIGARWQQDFANLTGRTVHNPPDVIATFVNGRQLTVAQGKVALDAEGALPNVSSATHIEVTTVRPDGQAVAPEANYPRPVGDEFVPTLTQPWLQVPRRTAAGDGFQTHLGAGRPELSPTQRRALDGARTRAQPLSDAAYRSLVERADRLGFSEAQVQAALRFLQDDAPVTVNIPIETMAPEVWAQFRRDTHYRNGYDSEHGPHDTPEGRDGTEQMLFPGAYPAGRIDAADRPVYGALNPRLDPHGGASLYGSSYLVLTPEARARTTLTPKDSAFIPDATAVATPDHAAHLFTFEEMGRYGNVPVWSDGELTSVLQAALSRRPAGTSTRNYIEAQVHGGVNFKRDVAEMVVPVSVRDGHPQRAAEVRQFAEDNGITLRWTDGQRLIADADGAAVPHAPHNDGFQTYLGGPTSRAGETEVFVNDHIVHPRTKQVTGAVRTAYLYEPGALTEPELEHLADQVFAANATLPGNHYGAGEPGVDKAAQVRGIVEELRTKHVVRIHERAPGADPGEPGAVIASAALTPNWRGELNDGQHWLGGPVPEGYTYLSHLWGNKGAGADVTEAGVLAAQEHLGQSHFGFYTRWQGAQNLYGPRLGGHADTVAPAATANIPRMHITEASFTSDAASILRALSAEEVRALPPALRRLVRKQSLSTERLQVRLESMPNQVRFHGAVPHKVLRASYETVLLHEGVRIHAPRAPAAEGGTLTIAVNNHETFGPPDPRRHVNWLPDEPRFAKVRAAAEYYTPTYEGVQIITHSQAVYLRDPVTGKHYSENWPVGPDGKPMSPHEAADRLRQRDAREGPAFFLSCEIGARWQQDFANLTGRTVHNPPDVIATFVNGRELTVAQGKVQPNAEGDLPNVGSATHIEVTTVRPDGQPVVPASRYPQPVGERFVPTLTQPHLQQRPPLYRDDGFQGYFGALDPHNPRPRIEELQQVYQQARLAADVGDPGHAASPGTHQITGWRDISNDVDALRAYGLEPSDLLPADTRFVARLYEPTGAAPGPAMKPQLVFRGTARGLASEDWRNNVLHSSGRDSPYYGRAINIGEKLAASGADVDLVGHSLGGGLASLVAMMTGRSAVTFDAQGLHPRMLDRLERTTTLDRDAPIQSWRVDGEALTGLQRRTRLPDAAGDAQVVPGPANRLPGVVGRVPGVEPVRRHLIGAMLSGLEGMLQHVVARADPFPAGGAPVHAQATSGPYARFGGEAADIDAHLDAYVADPQAHVDDLHTLAREARLIQDLAAHERGEGVLPLFSRDRRRLLADFRTRFGDDPQGLAQLDVQAGRVAQRLQTELGIDLRVHDGYVADVVRGQAPVTGPTTAPVPFATARYLAITAQTNPLQAAKDMLDILRTHARNARQQPSIVPQALWRGTRNAAVQVGSWTYGSLAVVAATVTQGPGFLSGSFYQNMAVANRGRTGAVNGGSASWGRMRENALRGVTQGESFEQAAVHLDRIAGWRGNVIGLTRATIRDDIVHLRENLHTVVEARDHLATLERTLPEGDPAIAAASKALENAVTAYRKTALGSRTMAFNHPVGNVVRNVSLGVSTASLISFWNMSSFGAGYGAMGILEKVALMAPSAALLSVQAHYMYRQARSALNRLDPVMKAKETAAFWRQAWPYPALITGDAVTGLMGVTTGHYVEGGAYFARAVFNTVLWRMVMKRGQRIDPASLKAGEKLPWWYDVKYLGEFLHPTKPLDPTRKHWTTVAAVSGLLLASGVAYVAHPRNQVHSDASAPPPTGGPTDVPTDPPVGTQPPDQPPDEPPQEPPKPPRVTVDADGQSLWQIAQKHRDTLLTDEHRRRVAEEGLGPNAQTVLALGELMRLNRPAYGFDPALVDGVPSAKRGDPDTIHKGMELIVGRA